MEKIIRIVVSVLLLGLVAFLTYKIVDGIKTPIEYEEQRIARFQTTVDQLIDPPDVANRTTVLPSKP